MSVGGVGGNSPMGNAGSAGAGPESGGQNGDKIKDLEKQVSDLKSKMNGSEGGDDPLMKLLEKLMEEIKKLKGGEGADGGSQQGGGEDGGGQIKF
jgi:hypothetical protein